MLRCCLRRRAPTAFALPNVLKELPRRVYFPVVQECREVDLPALPECLVKRNLTD